MRQDLEHMELDSVVVRVPGVTAAPVGDDLVILNLARDDYVALDVIGRRVWELVEEPRTVADVCASLRSEFEDPAQRIEADVLDFLNELSSEGLVRVVQPPQ
jgi:hypothetical protein